MPLAGAIVALSGRAGRAGRAGRGAGVASLVDPLVAAVDVELLLVVAGLRLDLDGLVVTVHEVAQLVALLDHQDVGHLGVAVDHQHRILEVRRLAPDLPEGLVGHGDLRLEVTLAVAVAARLVHHPRGRLADPLPGHLDQPQLRDLEDVGLGLVAPQRLLQGLEDLLAVLRLVHVDEVDDDDAADVAEPELVDDLLGRLDVDLGDGLLEALLADVAPRVDVHGGERLGLVDDDVAAALEPDLALPSPLQLLLDPEGVEHRLVTGVEFDLRLEVRRLLVHEAQDALVLVAVVDHHLADLGGEEVAGGAQDQVEVAVQQRRRAHLVLGPDDLVPDLDEEADVGFELLGVDAVGHGADDEAGPLRAHPVDDIAKPAPLAVALDAARDADVVHGRHEDQVAPRQRDVAGDAGALGADGVLGDLDDHLLPFLEQVLDVLQLLGLALLAGAAAAAVLAVALAVAPLAFALGLPVGPRLTRLARRLAGRRGDLADGGWLARGSQGLGHPGRPGRGREQEEGRGLDGGGDRHTDQGQLLVGERRQRRTGDGRLERGQRRRKLGGEDRRRQGLGHRRGGDGQLLGHGIRLARLDGRWRIGWRQRIGSGQCRSLERRRAGGFLDAQLLLLGLFLGRDLGGAGGVLALGQLELLGEVGITVDVPDVEEGRLLQADVDEGGLHAREDPDHAPLVDVADDPLLALSLEVVLVDRPVLDQRDARLRARGVDYEAALVLGHGGLR